MINIDERDGARPSVLVVDDTPVNRRLLSALFASEGYEVVLAEDGETALGRFSASPTSVVVLDLRMPGIGGMATLKALRQLAPQVPVVMLTSHGDIEEAVEATRLGAYDFLVRPLHNDKVVLTVRRALERHFLLGEVESLRRRLEAPSPLGLLEGKSPRMRVVVGQIQKVAASNLTVLIQGETGTGKELVARAIHYASARSTCPFVALDCGALPAGVIESELFGHERGAFTGADRRVEGHFRAAAGGTVFLDEIGNLPLPIQVKLLRVIQERQVQPLGGRRAQPIDVRFIAATNESLEQRIRTGEFREDLFYRLAEFTINLPPLRDRSEDIIMLARRFQVEACTEMKLSVGDLSADALALLASHRWPGNVRELRNVIRRAVVRSDGSAIGVEQLSELLAAGAARESVATSVDVRVGATLKEVADAAVAAAETNAIRAALRASRGNKTQAARQLGVDYKTLHLKMKRYGLASKGDADE